MANRLLLISALMFTLGCGHKAQVQVAPPPEITQETKSKMPSNKSEIIHHCVVINSENSNTVTCECDAVHTKIDSKTGRTTITCKAIQDTQ